MKENDALEWNVRTADFEAGMLRLEQGVKQGFVQPEYGTLPVQSRLLAERCQAFTPPSTAAEGRAAVTRDITGIFRPISSGIWREKQIRKIVRTDNREDWNALAKNLSAKSGLRDTTAVGFNPDVHQRLRNKRGFVNRGSRKGRWVTLGPESAKVKKYLAEIKKRVGWAKAGWNATILRFGGNISGGWLANHGQGHGRVNVNMNMPDPFVQSVNETGWAKYQNREGQRVIQNAVLARARDMQAYFERMMKLAADKV